MEQRQLGRTGLQVSRLTFGCGAVGGLMTKGTAADQDRAVAWAIDHGINHFDTAPLYGNGASETNLGRALNGRHSDLILSTKVRISQHDLEDLDAAIRRSIETSLSKLRRDRIDLFQLHNTISMPGTSDSLDDAFVLEQVVVVFEKLREEGKTRFLGFTANGETAALHRLVASGRFDAAQIFYNVLAPSAGEPIPETYPGQDYRGLLKLAHEAGVGSIGVRVLAGGAMSGRVERHPLGMPSVGPIGSAQDYATDAAHARAFQPIVDAGHVNDLPELALRYVISNPLLATTEIGIATLDELQFAAKAINKGPLPPAAMLMIDEIRGGFTQSPV